MMSFLFFFFQAEDGIRDDLVTGVQTCALPIWRDGAVVGTEERIQALTGLEARSSARGSDGPAFGRVVTGDARAPIASHALKKGRSEERRVGKEWRTGWWTAP